MFRPIGVLRSVLPATGDHWANARMWIISIRWTNFRKISMHGFRANVYGRRCLVQLCLALMGTLEDVVACGICKAYNSSVGQRHLLFDTLCCSKFFNCILLFQIKNKIIFEYFIPSLATNWIYLNKHFNIFIFSCWISIFKKKKIFICYLYARFFLISNIYFFNNI